VLPWKNTIITLVPPTALRSCSLSNREGLSLRATASELNRSLSTLNRELRQRTVEGRPYDAEFQVSHENVYKTIYAQLKGKLRKELISRLRQVHTKRALPG